MCDMSGRANANHRRGRWIVGVIKKPRVWVIKFSQMYYKSGRANANHRKGRWIVGVIKSHELGNQNFSPREGIRKWVPSGFIRQKECQESQFSGFI